MQVNVSDGTDVITAVFFGAAGFLQKLFNEGEFVILSGKVNINRTKQIVHPDFDFIDENSDIKSINTGRIIPLYRSTNSLKKHGFDSRGFRRTVRAAIEQFSTGIEETLPDSMLEKYKPEWHKPLMNIINGADLKTEYANLPAGPIEDVTQQVFQNDEALIVELPFKWYDFGTFESIHKYLNENGLYKTPENVIELESNNNYVRLDDPNKVICMVGVGDLAVVDTGDVLLICRIDKTGEVKEVLNQVKERNISLT